MRLHARVYYTAYACVRVLTNAHTRTYLLTRVRARGGAILLPSHHRYKYRKKLITEHFVILSNPPYYKIIPYGAEV